MSGVSRPGDDERADVLIVLTDFPGEAYRMAAALGRVLLTAGFRPAFLLTSRYMERFKGQAFHEVGPTFYLSSLLREPRGSMPSPPDGWWMHGSFVRQEYYLGRSLVGPNDYESLRGTVEEVLDRVRPALVWSEPPTTATLSVLHHATADRGVTYWGIVASRIPGHFQISTDFWAAELVESGGDNVPEIMPTGRPDYMRHIEAGRPEGTKRASFSKRVLRGLRAGVGEGVTSVETGWGPGWQIASILRRFQRGVRTALRGLYPVHWDHDNACIKAQPSFLFPLHVRPEASTSMWARYYEEDLQTVRNLAFSLPGDATLVVKEHPAAAGLRPRSFYQAMRRFPRVRLARPGLDVKDIVSHFAGVVVLTSTVGFEALLQAVPVLVLGRIFYEGYPGATRAVGWEDVTPWMARAAAGELSFDASGIWPLYRRHVFPGHFDVRDMASAEPANIARLAAPVVDALRQGL